MAVTKKTFILENDAGKALGTFTGATPGVAAKKAATKGHTHIVLRQTGEHDKVRIYKGTIVKLATPKTVTIAGKPVTITKTSKATFVKVLKKDDDKKTKA
ncbi:chromosomal protein MC1a [Acanthocystis turfacea Chlorella virus MO0605SPH]|uniref:Uncharacterized protein Z131L n=1 Tax=Chlorovirus heliozoae TaxID=322019 RepID=A7K891_9PHYC|nr:hypothetical protein ATCV1_Z131L [Acanthocystis turfacea chlorella virus 1]AGE49394.1 chromosomal protein MC1a [Acanthocystis turfacea Chlorella virus Can0610SP]AGE55883.1 chromosomal protein MC1a [Acanthocystis turfacea Chlorella virus MO0605SPH]AGE56877.1 chromosomal protein MC1a [Acanthocystis turfacea Chlorella virus NE-JV-3]AGE59330.1 chromosomal protein MC1a [Acanthocystis turfacea Chlorella virus OR0704.3]AGE60000.1 chromosomal protein MC1a [Acanthocystis turfacea Chlorella virus WI0